MKRHAITFLLTILAASFTFAQTGTDLPKGPTTTIEFEEDEFDFGIITEGEKISHLYVFTNTGDKPLIIKGAKGSCGCTVPMWPKEPIMPGESAEMMVEFNSKGKAGVQSKRVTITANTDPAQTFLVIKGEVKAKEGDTKPKSEKAAGAVLDNSLTEEKSPWDFNEALKPKAKDCFAIFPNPTSEVLKLDLKEHLGKAANISIFNAAGKRMTARVIKNVEDNITEFDVNNYSAGTYYINIQIGKETTTTKCFVVAK